MYCTREDLNLVKEAIRVAIADGRDLPTTGAKGFNLAAEESLIQACKRLSSDPAPALLQALGNHALLCLVQTDFAAMKAHKEIRKLMGL